MQGTSGSYAVNGVSLTLAPTSANWVIRDELGRDGNNRPIYPSIRNYEMTWELMPTVDLKQIIDAGTACITGTVVTDLPKWGDATYTYHSYTGTIWNEPQVGAYFVEHVSSVSLLISNVRTN